MKYDPIELAKLNLTEDSIQMVRDMILELLTIYETDHGVVYIDKVYLPFVVDMLDGHTFTCNPERGRIKIVVKL